MANWILSSLLFFTLSLDGCCFSKAAVAPDPEPESPSVPSVHSISDQAKKELKFFAETMSYDLVAKFHNGKLPIDKENKLTPHQKAEQEFFMQCVEERYKKDKLFIMMMYPEEGR